MDTDDDYELLPHKEIVDLKKQLESYKKGPSSAGMSSMDNLSDSINNLLALFKEAGTTMNLEEHEQDILTKEVVPLSQKVDKLLEHSQRIAEGIVALADMLKELNDKIDEVKEKQSAPPPPRMPLPRQFRPMPQQNFGQNLEEMPPLRGPMGPPPMPPPPLR
ncbi:MAG: hypothetical protein V1740_00600 [Candidatus Woesearchaeota archaeon]